MCASSMVESFKEYTLQIILQVVLLLHILLNSSVQNFCVRGGKEAWRILSEPNPWFQCVAWKQEASKKRPQRRDNVGAVCNFNDQ